MRLRVAEIDENPIAHILGDKTRKAADRFGDAAVIGAEICRPFLGWQIRKMRVNALRPRLSQCRFLHYLEQHINREAAFVHGAAVV
jgi:hypothetical protein